MSITYDMITKVEIKIVEKKRIKGEEIPMVTSYLELSVGKDLLQFAEQ